MRKILRGNKSATVRKSRNNPAPLAWFLTHGFLKRTRHEIASDHPRLPSHGGRRQAKAAYAATVSFYRSSGHAWTRQLATALKRPS